MKFICHWREVQRAPFPESALFVITLDELRLEAETYFNIPIGERFTGCLDCYGCGQLFTAENPCWQADVAHEDGSFYVGLCQACDQTLRFH